MVVDHVFKFGVFSRLQMLLGKKTVIKHLYHGVAWICGCGDFGWQWRGYVLSDQPIVFFKRCAGLRLCDWTINACAFGSLLFVECVAIFKIFAAIWMNPYIQFGATNKKCLFSRPWITHFKRDGWLTYWCNQLFCCPQSTNSMPKSRPKNTAGDAVTGGYCGRHRTISHEQHRPVGL